MMNSDLYETEALCWIDRIMALTNCYLILSYPINIEFKF